MLSTFVDLDKIMKIKFESFERNILSAPPERQVFAGDVTLSYMYTHNDDLFCSCLSNSFYYIGC